MTETRLDPIVDTGAPSLRRVRKRIALASGVLLGAAGTGALMHATASERPTAPPVVVSPPTTFTVPPPLVLHIEQAAPAPTPAPPPEALGCPAIAREDLPIGAPVTIRAFDDDDATKQVVAAANSKQIAVRIEGRVWISDDDGRSFREVLDDRYTDALVLDRDGTLYAASKGELGVRAPGGRFTWRSRAVLGPDDYCDDCDPSLGLLGREVVWIERYAATFTTDRGRTWTRVDPDYAPLYGGRILSWGGALYQVARYKEECGIDNTHVFQLDARHRTDLLIFPNDYIDDRPELVADSDTASTWTWRQRCLKHSESTGNLKKFGACETRDATRTTLLATAHLMPTEGARTLALWRGLLVELCGNGARQVARSFPFDRIDAVDAVGRPLVLHHRTLFRWSPVHGWRRLFTAPDKPAD